MANQHLISGELAARKRCRRLLRATAKAAGRLAGRFPDRTSLRGLCAHLAFLTFLTLAFLVTGSIHSTLAVELDDARLSRSWPGAAHWRWDNVECAPQWVCGVRPFYKLKYQIDVVDLNPGESSTFRIPRRGAVRVVGVGGGLAPNDVELWVSNGSGLYRRQLTAINQKDGSLIAVPDMSDVGLARVVRSSTCSSPVRVALFTSQFLAPEFIEGYRCQVKGCGKSVKLSDSEMGPLESSPYWQLSPGGEGSVCITGPVRLELATRYRYTEADSTNRQMYRVYISQADNRRRTLEYITSSEQRRHVHLDGCEQLVGMREVAYLDVPAGKHCYRFEASACVLFQARVLSCGIYRNPCYNSPRYFPRQARPAGRPETLDSIWEIPSSDVGWFLRRDPADVVAQSALALRSARDNRYRQGGLRATMMMLAASAARPAEPTTRQFADELRRHGTFFRPLLPRWQDPGVTPQPAYYLTRVMRDPRQTNIDVVIGEQLIQDSVDITQLGHFHAAGSCWANAAEYVLPHDLGPSALRVVIDASSLSRATRLQVQYDQRDPVALLAMPKCELKLGDYYPSRAETGLAALHWAHAGYDSGTLGGPFAALNKQPARLVSAGHCELIIPGGVHAIRVWADTDSTQRPRIALAYRTSRRYRLTEPAYYDARLRAGADHLTLLDALIHRKQPPVLDPFAFEEIRNHWEPLVRMLSEFEEQTKAGLALPPDTSSVPPSDAQVDEATAIETARQLAARRQWLPALENWTELTQSASESVQRQAQIGRIEALAELNELVLAKNELLGILFTTDDYILEQLAYEQMIELLLRQPNKDALERFIATMVVQRSTPDRVSDLADAFLVNGRFEQALLLALMVPIEHRPTETVLRAAYHLGWWRTFDQSVATLGPAEANFWTALKLLKWGHLDAAQHQLAGAGAEGAAWLKHWQLGEHISNRLSETDADSRACAVHAWEAWQAHHPGPRTWREEGALVSGCPSTASVYSVDRDAYGQYYAAEPGNPLQLTVHGPVDLRFEVRPLHNTDSVEPQDDWLSIESATAASVWPITTNRPSRGLELVGTPEKAVGGKVHAYLRLGSGRHEISLAAERLDTLVRVCAARPEIPLPVLPALNVDTLTAINSGLFRRPRLAKFVWRRSRTHPPHNLVAHILPRGCRETRHAPFVQFGPHDLAGCETPPSQGSCGDECALCAAIADGFGGEPTCGQASPTCSSSSSRDELCTTPTILSSLTQMPGWSSYENTPWRFQMERLAEADLEAALATPCENDLWAVRQKMALLVYWAESNPAKFAWCHAEATALVEQFPGYADLASLFARLSRSSSWQLRRDFDASAGVRTLELSDRIPDEPRLRIRRTMLRGISSSDSLLAGQQQLVVDLKSVEPSQFTFRITRPAVGFMPVSDMEVVWQLDSQPQESIQLLEAGQSQRVTVNLPRGEHQLRVWNAHPLANHCALIRMEEDQPARPPGPDEPPGIDQLPAPRQAAFSIAKQRRAYQVATHDEPIRFHAQGPATVRIDELRGTTTFTSIQVVGEDAPEITLRPVDGQKTALFRIFQRRSGPNANLAPEPVVDTRPRPVPGGWLEESLAESGHAYRLYDGSTDWFAPQGRSWGDGLSMRSLLSPEHPPRRLRLDDQWLIGHEDGTWGFRGGYVRRRSLEEANRVAEIDKFTEIAFIHYQYDEWKQKYGITKRVSRIRDRGGVTNGFNKTGHFIIPSSWTWIPRQFKGLWGSRDPFVRRYPINVTWDARAFMQLMDSQVRAQDGEKEWSATIAGRVFRPWQLTSTMYHIPAASIFRRVMSLDENPYAPGEIDQDVFTEFKNDHRFGYTLSDKFVFQPTVDRVWWARPMLFSNQDFRLDRPDHISLRLGHSRVTGPWSLEGSYRVARFFRDDNRAEYGTQHLLYLESRLNGWLDSGNRLELSSGVAHDVTLDRTSAYMFFTWYHSRGRGLWDFHKADMPLLPVVRQNAFPMWFGQGAH